MAQYYKSTITIISDYPPTRDIEALARDAVSGESICTDHSIVEVTGEEVSAVTGEFFPDLA